MNKTQTTRKLLQSRNINKSFEQDPFGEANMCPGGQEISHFYGTLRLIISHTTAQHRTNFDLTESSSQSNTHTHTHSNFNIQFHSTGYAVTQSVEALGYKPEVRRFASRWGHRDFRLNLSGRITALQSTQSVTEMSTWGVKAAGA